MILSTEFTHELTQNTHRELAFVGLAECSHPAGQHQRSTCVFLCFAFPFGQRPKGLRSFTFIIFNINVHEWTINVHKCFYLWSFAGHCFSLGLAGNATALGQRPKGLRPFVFMIFNINVHEPLSLMTEEHKSMFPFCSYVLMSQRIHPGGARA